MMRVVLIHWKPEETTERVQALREFGLEARVAAPMNAAALRGLAEGTAAFLIDLTRLPLQGRAIGIELRKRAESRGVPLVFMGGAAAKVEEVRRVLPDAGYVFWDELPLLRDVMARAPRQPVTPGTMAGYSGTPLPKKLGIKAGSKVALVGAPEGFEAKLSPLPDDVTFSTRAKDADRIVLFVTSAKEFAKRWSAVAGAAREGATVWVAWPKKASGIATDISERSIRAHGLENGWVDYKICAMDETWSGLAFVRRKAARAAP
jgi:hypothetical protein